MKEVIVQRPNDREIEYMRTCPVWEHDAGEFPWSYKERRETCLIIEGKAYVEGDGKRFSFGEGDLVTFPTHWECKWVILEPIKKHYVFDIDF